MKPLVNIAVIAALFLVTPNPCFALWMIAPVGKVEAKKPRIVNATGHRGSA
jgi:hypothetical protein